MGRIYLAQLLALTSEEPLVGEGLDWQSGRGFADETIWLIGVLRRRLMRVC